MHYRKSPLEAFVVSRLIPLDKNPEPISGKVIVTHARDDINGVLTSLCRGMRVDVNL